MRLLLLVSAGGAIGAALRFLTYQLFVAQAAHRGAGAFPWATLTVNVVGSFLMGVLMVFIWDRLDGNPEVRAFLATGLLGGFTTFSAFSLDVFELGTARAPAALAAYVMGSVVLSVGGLVAGIAVTRYVLE